MSQKVDLYDTAYGNYESHMYRKVRMETYGEDFGQTSWVTTEESKEIPRLLDLRPNSSVLELGCGSGGYALHLAEKVGCRLVGLDINAPGVRNANQLALSRGLASQARFEQCDVSNNLPFDDNAFDAVFSNDVLCHIRGRPKVLGEMFRILKPGGRMLFSDALVVGGMLSHEEIATRSSIGFYVYSPPEKMNDSLSVPGFAGSAQPTQLRARPGSRSSGIRHVREGNRNWSQRKATSTSRDSNGSCPVCIS